MYKQGLEPADVRLQAGHHPQKQVQSQTMSCFTRIHLYCKEIKELDHIFNIWRYFTFVVLQVISDYRGSTALRIRNDICGLLR